MSCSRSFRRFLTTNNQFNIFDRKTKLKQRDWSSSKKDYETVMYVKDEFGFRTADRVFDVKRSFPLVIDLGCGRGHVSRHFTEDMVDQLVLVDTCRNNLDNVHLPEDASIKISRIQADEETLPFKGDFADLVVTNLALHWVNNLPGVFSTIRSILKPDGAFIGCMFGGDTLHELRSSLYLAEMERHNGFSPHISPFVRPPDVAGLLGQAGFNLITVDTDQLVIGYPSMSELMTDLQLMGESNCSWNRPLHLRRDTMTAAAAIYKSMFGNEDGSVRATFEVVAFIGWKPHPSQPKPIKRGSAEFSLKDIPDIDKIIRKSDP